MSRLQAENDRILNATEEGAVATIIQLYDGGYLHRTTKTRRENITFYLAAVNIKDPATVSYWLNEFNVND